MKTAGIEELTKRVRQLVADSTLSDSVRDISIEPTITYDEDEVLRVHIALTRPAKVATRDASALVSRIVDELWSMDDRFPSVRFDEAA